MNILPLVIALALMLSIMTIEKLDKFKNQIVVQKEYQHFLQYHERKVFNKRQDSLFGNSQTDLCQLSFRYFIDKKAREKNENIYKQFYLLNKELMKILYSEADFYKNLEKTRPHFLDEMLKAIQTAADSASDKTIKRIQDIARLDLEDEELQQAFYHMLKGNISRKELEKLKKTKDSAKDRGYISLFNFINYNGKEKTPLIMIQLAPREILKAIFVEDDIVEAIVIKRNELAANKTENSVKEFKDEFLGKRRPGLDDVILDFSISSSDKTKYN